MDNSSEEISWKYKCGLGVMTVGMDYTTSNIWPNNNTLCFEGIGGDIDPLHGAWEWIDLKRDKTLLIFTSALHIGDQASWLLKLANNIPNINILCGIYMGVLVVEKQSHWLEPQVRSMNGEIADNTPKNH